jgi:hypothetical protein
MGFETRLSDGLIGHKCRGQRAERHTVVIHRLDQAFGEIRPLVDVVHVSFFFVVCPLDRSLIGVRVKIDDFLFPNRS